MHAETHIHSQLRDLALTLSSPLLLATALRNSSGAGQKLHPQFTPEGSRAFQEPEAPRWESWEILRLRCGQRKTVAKKQSESRQMLRDPKKKTDAEILGAAETEETEDTQEREREIQSLESEGLPPTHPGDLGVMNPQAGLSNRNS